MKSILLITDSKFFKKNFKLYIQKKKIKKKLIVKSSKQVSKKFFDSSRINKNIEFCVVNFGLSGGIKYNIENGCNILEKNISGYLKVLNCLKEANIRKVYFISASCVYPKNLEILNENDFAKTDIEKTSLHYAASKMLGTFFSLAVNKNKKFKWKSIVPATLYGKYNITDKNNAHVIGAFFEKFKHTKKKLILWGSGNVKREFLHVMDFIDAIFFIDQKKLSKEIINVGSGVDISIKNLAKIFSELYNFQGNIVWDTTKPDGAKRKLLNSSYLFSKGWKPKVDLRNAILELINDRNSFK